MSGGSKSSSSTSTSTADNRGVADNGSLIVSGSSQAQVTMTDMSAVAKALDFATSTGNQLISADSTNLNRLISANSNNYGKLLDVGLKVLDQGQKNIDTTASTLSTAYQDAKGGSINNQYIAMLGVGAVVAVAFAFSSKGH